MARLKDTEEVCFMCGITDKVFNRTIGRDTFKKHIKNEQNLWNYVYYIIAIWEQDKDDDDGLEWQIRRYIGSKVKLLTLGRSFSVSCLTVCLSVLCRALLCRTCPGSR
jgi:hypothetical protein